MGFDGKQCIHPAQLAAVNSIFMPSAEEVARAERVVEAYEQAVAERRGAASLDGKMIDAANIRMARVVLEKDRRPGGNRNERALSTKTSKWAVIMRHPLGRTVTATDNTWFTLLT